MKMVRTQVRTLPNRLGILQNHLSDPGIEAFDPQDAQNAPEQRVEQADPAVEIEGHPTVTQEVEPKRVSCPQESRYSMTLPTTAPPKKEMEELRLR